MMPGLPKLESDGLILRPWAHEDAADLEREIQDPEIIYWLQIELPYTLEDARSFISTTSRQWDARQAAHFVIANRDGAFCGYIAALSVEQSMSVVEIVYWVTAGARGRNVAGRALRILLPWLVETVGPERIELGMLEGNTASARTAESAGFVLREVIESDSGTARELIYELASD